MGVNDLRAKRLLAKWGMKDHGGPTDSEIGQMMGISRGRVYQLRMNAIRKIREAIAGDPELRELAEEVCGKKIDFERT